MVNKLFKLIKYLVNLPIYYLFSLLKKNENIIVFGAWFGNKYSDNPKYLFEYVIRNQPSFTPIWLTKNREVIKMLRKRGDKCYYLYSLAGYYYSAKARYVVVSSGRDDVNKFALSKKTKLIHLWHGTPLKKIYHDDKYHVIKSNKLKDFIFPFLSIKYSALIASSDEVKNKISSAFHIKSDFVKVTGYPRNDAFSIKKSLSSYRDVLIGYYLPTFRDSGRDLFLNNIQDNFKKIDEFLSENNIVVYYKFHQKDEEVFNDFYFQSFKPLKINHPEKDLYNYLNKSDFIITDYSSIYFDYMLLNKPIIFYDFDLKLYLEKDREMYYAYCDVTPGAHVSNFEEMKNALSNIKLGIDLHKNEREKLNKIFNLYNDGNNSKRVFNECIINNNYV